MGPGNPLEDQPVRPGTGYCGHCIPVLNVVLAVGISVPLSYVAILITGKTDSTLVSALGKLALVSCGRSLVTVS